MPHHVAVSPASHLNEWAYIHKYAPVQRRRALLACGINSTQYIALIHQIQPHYGKVELRDHARSRRAIISKSGQVKCPGG